MELLDLKTAVDNLITEAENKHVSFKWLELLNRLECEMCQGREATKCEILCISIISHIKFNNPRNNKIVKHN